MWNTNEHTGLVGVFHLQGAAWSRRKRQFLIHDASPPPLGTTVRVADVEQLLSAGSPADRCVPPQTSHLFVNQGTARAPCVAMLAVR